MEKVMNFKRMEVTGTTKEEALEKAPFGIMGDATQAYRNARKACKGAWTDAEMKQFMLDYLAKKSKNLAGAGFSITVESAVAKELAKALYTEKGFKSDLICRYTKQVVDGEPIAFTAEYTPSKSSRIGTYIVFGIENA